ncbi:zinc finger protein 569 isoform X2 [Agrilus planipennis]|uniref:Zinc finger protein 569 isoform X2 n=1 Tax=Agrilus planipennis TaxID=224129 RepID=A0A1W4WR60_AGRPL|nr:zinc finger protein 569 isoform X2 [Agrilus planipennis]
MEIGTSDDTLYFTCLEDKQAFLLHNSSVDICEETPHLNIEPMFTEIFFSENYTPENAEESSFSVTNSGNSIHDLSTENVNNGGSVSNSIRSQENNGLYPVEVAEKGFVATDLFTPTDLLLQLNLQCESTTSNHLTHQNNPREQDINNVQTILYSEDLTLDEDHSQDKKNSNENSNLNIKKPNDVSFKNTTNPNLDMHELNSNTDQTSNQIIHLLNTDGSVISINKSLLSPSVFQNKPMYRKETLQEFYELVSAFKCKECGFLCEKDEEIIKHINEVHPKTIETKDTPSDSLLSVTNNKVEKKIPKSTEKNMAELDKGPLQKLLNKDIKMVSILNKKNNSHNIKKTLFLCSQCNIGYTKKETLKSHMIRAHPIIKTVPKQPKQEYIETANVMEMKVKEEEKIIQNKLKSTANLIKKHQKASKKIKCSIKGCELRFAREDTRKRHESCHIDGHKKQFACTECGVKFSIWRICSTHLWKCHKIDMDLLTCPMCNDFKANSCFRLISHMSIHNEEKPFLCNICGKAFKTISQLRTHQVIHKEVPPGWLAQQQCTICQKFFANSKSLKKHIQCVHNKYKPFICNVCGHKSARKAMLELHLRQHTGEKPHKCLVCEYKTGDHNSLRRHMMRHSGDMKYACPHCDYQSIQSAAYKKHLANKHPGQGGSYFCELCSYHTVNENTYASHLMDHVKGLIPSNIRGEVKNNSINSTETNTITEKSFVAEPKKKNEVEDDETQNCFLSLDNSDETVDTGGITIPESLDL